MSLRAQVAKQSHDYEEIASSGKAPPRNDMTRIDVVARSNPERKRRRATTLAPHCVCCSAGEQSPANEGVASSRKALSSQRHKTCVTKNGILTVYLSLEFLPSEASHFQATGFVLTGIVDDVHKVVKG